MIRVLTVDDHPALRAGLKTVLQAEPGIVPVGAADSAFELWPLLHSTRPDVVILDLHLPGSNALVLCRTIKAELAPPKVLIYSAYAGPPLVVPAALAGADGMLSKSVAARDLYAAIREIAGGSSLLPELTAELRAQALDRLDGEDRELAEALLAGRTPAEAGLAPDEVGARMDRMLDHLQPVQPEAAATG